MVESGLNPVMQALGSTVLSTPDVTGNPQFKAIWTTRRVFVAGWMSVCGGRSAQRPDRRVGGSKVHHSYEQRGPDTTTPVDINTSASRRPFCTMPTRRPSVLRYRLLHLPAKLATHAHQGQNGRAETHERGSKRSDDGSRPSCSVLPTHIQ